MLHRRSLIDSVVLWRPPAVTECSPDVDFVLRCHYAGAKIVSTRSPTLFKFSTTNRRGAYRTKDTAELERTLAALREDAEGFVKSELVALVQCAVEDRLIRFEAEHDRVAAVDMSHVTRNWRRFKGSH